MGEMGILPPGAEIDRVVQQLDRDSSGWISFQEFVEYFTPDQRNVSSAPACLDQIKAIGAELGLKFEPHLDMTRNVAGTLASKGVEARGKHSRAGVVGDVARGVLRMGAEERLSGGGSQAQQVPTGSYHFGDVTRGLVRAVQ